MAFEPADGAASVVFREMARADIPFVAALRKRQLLEEGATATEDLTAPLEDYYEKHLADGSFVCLLAVDGNEIVAMGGLSIADKPPYYGNPTGQIGMLSGMYTLAPYRRKGIARELVRRLVGEARQRGCGVVHLTASDMGAPLYESCGFQRNENFFQLRFAAHPG